MFNSNSLLCAHLAFDCFYKSVIDECYILFFRDNGLSFLTTHLIDLVNLRQFCMPVYSHILSNPNHQGGVRSWVSYLMSVYQTLRV